MPFVIINSREPLSPSLKETLAETISKSLILIEINVDTPEIRKIDWIWFKTIGADNWSVGGKFDDSVVQGRTMILAEIIAPEALMDRELKLKALKTINQCLRDALDVPASDDGTGLFSIITEVPIIDWGVNGNILPTRDLISQTHGDVPQKRLDDIDAHFAGLKKMRDTFGIPQ